MGASRALMDVEKIPKINNLLKMYIKDERLISSDITNEMNETAFYYRTANTSKINNLTNEINRNFSRINRIHNMNTLVYSKMVDRYNNEERKTSKSFDQLGGK